MAEGLVETLRDLKNSRGILACLVSNNPVQRALAAMRYAANGEGEQLAALLGTRLFEADERQKPLPDVYLRALAQTGAAAAEAIAIEDSVTGATSARAAGLRVLGFTGFADEPEKAAQKLRDAGCTAVFHNWRDIQPLLAH